jgi:hypothetical protein
MNDHARSIDIRHHEIKQDYVQNNMRIGGVSSANDTADILTKTLQPPIHAKHCAPLHILNPTIQNTTPTLHTMAVFATKNNTNTNHSQTDNKEARKQKRKAKKQRRHERNYRLLVHARQIASRHHTLTNHETANLTTILSTSELTSSAETPRLRQSQLHSHLVLEAPIKKHHSMFPATPPRQSRHVQQTVKREHAFLATTNAPLPLDDRFWRSKRQLTQTHPRGQQNVIHTLDIIGRRPRICHRPTAQERHQKQNTHKTHQDFPPQFLELICPTHKPKTHILQAHVRHTQPTNPNPTTTKKRHTHRDRTPKHAHTPPRCDPNLRNGGEKKMPTHTTKTQGQISTKRKETKNQKCQSSKRSPEHTLLKCKNHNANMTKPPKPNLTQNRSATQLYRTKTTTAIVTTKFWPTSSGSPELGRPESITVEFLPIHHSDIHPSQLNFLDTKEHQQTMPQTAKMDFIRTK